MSVNSVLLKGIIARNEDERLILFVPPKSCACSISRDSAGNWETVDTMDAIVEIPGDYFPELKPEDHPIPVRCMVSLVACKSEDNHGCTIL